MKETFSSGLITHSTKQSSTLISTNFDNANIVKPLFDLNDLVLTAKQFDAIHNILILAENEQLIYHTWGLGKVLKRAHGIKVNIYGAPGTGKTMAAHAIAKEMGKKLLQVSYAEIESRYVGDTSKNIVSLFRIAQEADAVLLFDEADAMLSKRVTEMHSSADVSVNQSRSVLLKVLDDYDGVCIFTTNFIQNYDQAFLRRIPYHIHFDLPDQEQRIQLWKHYLVPELPYDADPQRLAENSATASGADIANAVLNAAIQCAASKAHKIVENDFIRSINEIINAKSANIGINLTDPTKNSRQGVNQF